MDVGWWSHGCGIKGISLWNGGLQWWINGVRTDKKVSHNVDQRTSALRCHGSPLMARSFSNTDAFHRFNGVRDRDVFFLCYNLLLSLYLTI